MASRSDIALPQTSAVAHLLQAPRFEVIPVAGIVDKVASLSAGVTVTITASPAHGIERTVAVAEDLAARGYDVVPHLAARMIASHDQLENIVGRLAAAGIDGVFVVGGDASPPAGPYAAAADLLDVLTLLGRPFARVGIGGYPEGHPLIADGALLQALQRKQGHADYIVTQLCFDAGALARWIRLIRAAGIEIPVVVGLPGAVERRKLVEISLKTGVGASLRYLTKHGRQIATLARSRRYDPTPLARAVAESVGDAHLGVAGAHLFTFNQVEATNDWVRSVISG
jgi:methylenetetrahydrofolate reductase (NADPH)